MKILSLLLMSLSLFAGTQYVTPNMVVENKPMYCTNYYGESITSKAVGDIVDGDYAKQNCSYAKSTIENTMAQRLKSHNRKHDEEKSVNVLITLVSALVLICIFLISMLLS